jgi:hypothetical protein
VREYRGPLRRTIEDRILAVEAERDALQLEVDRLRPEVFLPARRKMKDRAHTAEARVERLEQALRETVNYSRGYVNDDVRSHLLAALHPDRLYACRFNNALYAQPCDRCDGTCLDQREEAQ